MLIIESGVTQPMPHGRENASNGYPDEGEYKDVEEEMGYQQTLMYGRYSRSLAAATKEESRRLRRMAFKHRKESKRQIREPSGRSRTVAFTWKQTFAKLGEDWVFLAILGFVMAFISFGIDFGIEKCVASRRLLYEHVTLGPVAKYFAWISLPVLLIQFATGFVHVLAPQAMGSGIPEIKTILRGVVLKEYLTGSTLIAKIIGLTATLGSGMPLGKEGPFVHIASIVATLMSKMVARFQGIDSNESRKGEMLAAAAAVGVACCFAAPVGGVLFSIECTTVFFAVRNYWRGFFAAVCGAAMFRLIAIWTSREDTVVALFRTTFAVDYPFDPLELFIFAGMGAVCGVAGALYVYLHRRYVTWMRGNKRLTRFLQRNRFMYPTIVAILLASATFPLGPGQFHAGILGTQDQVDELFSSITWGTVESSNLTSEHYQIRAHWESPHSSVFANLAIFVAYTYFGSILASTLPVPTGVVIPSFKTGAAFGRLVGEGVALGFPRGISHGDMRHFIVPGGYALAGAAAFTGAVTHTISISVIVFEMTGQITHIIPVLIAVLASNAVAHLLGPSYFDSIILIKKLPYLPDILPSKSTAYNVFVEDFMLKNVKFIWRKMTFYELRDQLMANKSLRSFPLVDSPEEMVLLGSIQRAELVALIQHQISSEKMFETPKKKRFESQRRRQGSSGTQKEDLQYRRFEVTLVKGCSPGGTKTPKSILKKPQLTPDRHQGPSGFSFRESDLNMTITGPETHPSRKGKFQSLFKKPLLLSNIGRISGIYPPSKVSGDEVAQWEEGRMQQPVDFSDCQIDPAPFQLVEKTSLLKVHNLFSMVGVSLAYVTAIGKLVGVVGLCELRNGIESANGTRASSSSIPTTPMNRTSLDVENEESLGKVVEKK